MDGFSSIVFMKEIKSIVRKKGMSLIWQEPKEKSFINCGTSYLYKKAEALLGNNFLVPKSTV